MLSGASRTLGRAHVDLAAGIFSVNTQLTICPRDWCGVVIGSWVFNKITPFSVTLALSKSGYDKLMMGFVASIISRYLPCNWMHACLYFMMLSRNAIVSGSVL